MLYYTLLLLLWFGYVIDYPCKAANVLFIPMHVEASHKKSMVPLAEALTRKGHSVTIWNTFFVKQPVNSDLVEDLDFVIDAPNQFYADNFIHHNTTEAFDVWNASECTPFEESKFWYMCNEICAETWKQKFGEMMRLMLREWDLVVMDQFLAPCAYTLIDGTTTATVLMSTSLFTPSLFRSRGIPMQENNPYFISSFFRTTSFYQRLKAAGLWKLTSWLTEDTYTSYLIGSQLGHNFIEPFDLIGFQSKAVLAISMFPPGIDIPRPIAFDTFYLDLSTCKRAASLPLDVADFVNDPTSKGTIVATVGHLVSWKDAPDHIIDSFCDAFSRFPEYRIVWQYDGRPIKSQKHITTSEWIPQVDLLGHNKTIAFLSHMGLKSSLEGICAKVSFIAFPVYAEQPMNAQLLTYSKKLGDFVDRFDLSADSIETAIRNTLTDGSYQKRVEKTFNIMKDNIKNPMDVGVFWLEFAIRRSKFVHIFEIRGKSIGYIRYFCVDVIVAVVSLVLFLSWLARIAVIRSVRYFLSS